MTRLLSGLVLVAMTLTASIVAQEKLTLTTPVSKTTTEWSIAYFTIDVEQASMVIAVKDNTGERRVIAYPNATTDAAATATLIGQLNTANLTTKSLRRRILERLQADGHLGAGSFSGGN